MTWLPILAGIVNRLSGSAVTPNGIPTRVVSTIARIIFPGTFLVFKIRRMINPITATITSGDFRSPNPKEFFAWFAMIRPQLFAPSSAINRPIPALTACFKLTGMTLTTASRSPRNEIAMKRTPLKKMTPAVTAGEIPSFAIIAVTIPTLPSPGASAKGLFV